MYEWLNENPMNNNNDSRKVTIEDVLMPENLTAAYRAVKTNAGAPGIDGMTVEQLAPHIFENTGNRLHPNCVRDHIAPHLCGR